MRTALTEEFQFGLWKIVTALMTPHYNSRDSFHAFFDALPAPQRLYRHSGSSHIERVTSTGGVGDPSTISPTRRRGSTSEAAFALTQ